MSLTFGINTSKEFFELLLLEVDEYLKDDLNIRKAMMCAMLSFHLTDWLNKEVNNNGDLGSFRLSLNCPSLSIMHDIINGSKHFTLDTGRTKAVSDTILHQGPFSEQFSKQFTKSSLDIKLLDGIVVSFSDEIIKITEFWKSYFENQYLEKLS